ncbi:MAG TPA: hypothetical protein PKH65_04810 [Bacteroidia bacterium]|nr:hypothetical protein [Bacteroidia bacterium]HNT79982.1 hypothetical protein [Bacteroidia bacterium]
MIKSNRFLLSAIVLLVLGAALLYSPVRLGLIEIIGSILNSPLDTEFRSIGFMYLGAACVMMVFVLSIEFICRKNSPIIGNRFYRTSTFCCIVFYVGVLCFSVSHMPIWDDYGIALDFLCNVHDSNSFSQTLALIYEPHMESRFVVIKLLVYLFYKINGQIVIQPMIWICVPVYISLFYWMMKSTTSAVHNYRYALPVALLLFQFEFYDAIVWGTAAMQYHFVLLFAFLSFRYAIREKLKAHLFALLFAVLGAFTFGNGLILLPMLLLWYAYQRKWFYVASSFLVLLLTFKVYFFQHHEASISFDLMLKNAYQYPAYVLTFIGSCIQPMYNKWISLSIGCIVLTLFLNLLFKKYHQKNPLLFLFMVFIVGSALVAAVLRLKVENFDQALASRYGIFSAVFMVLLFLAYAEYGLISAKRLKHITLLFLAINLSAGVLYYPEVIVRKKKLEAFAFAWHNWHSGKTTDLIIPDKTGLTMASGSRLSRSFDNKIFYPLQ